MTNNKKIMSLPETELVPLDRIRPYWRNPRRVTEETVGMLVKSIQDFGYQQPIVVDSDMVIIVGHTRYAAMRRMGVTEVPVVVAKLLTSEEVKQYRLIDNRSGELSEWDMSALMEELDGMDMEKMVRFFPEFASFSENDEEFITAQETTQAWDQVQTEVEFVCPSCFHTFEVEVTKSAILAGYIGKDKNNDDSASA